MYHRLLLILLQSRLKNWELVLETTISIVAPASAAVPSSIKSQIHHLRGLAHLCTQNRELARQEFEKSLKSDVSCFDSLEQLLVNNILTSAEGISFLLISSEQDLVHSLDFTQVGELSDLLKTVYLSKLQKFQRTNIIDAILTKLERDYHLEKSFTVQIERADALFSIRKFKDCIALTTAL
jgi:hypothetical protein